MTTTEPKTTKINPVLSRRAVESDDEYGGHAGVVELHVGDRIYRWLSNGGLVTGEPTYGVYFYNGRVQRTHGAEGMSPADSLDLEVYQYVKDHNRELRELVGKSPPKVTSSDRTGWQKGDAGEFGVAR